MRTNLQTAALRLIALLTATSLLWMTHGCGWFSDEPPTAFYHWQTEFSLSERERGVLDTLAVDRIYVKYFDVDWRSDLGPVPTADVMWADSMPPTREIVPTVFLTNQVLRHIVIDSELDSLAENIWPKIAELHPQVPLYEIQLDCDWTGTTRDYYFSFLQRLRRQMPDTIQLSATIRLHQLRYPDQTGVPPVDRGMLMFYNMGNLMHWEESNSILNLDTAATYLDGPVYPLPLDLALPIYHWGILYRDGKMTRLLNRLSATELADTSRFHPLGEGRYQLLQSTYIGGYYAYRDDRIRLERITPELLRQSKRLLRRHRPERWGYLTFYHLDERLFDAIAAKDLAKVQTGW